MTDQDKMTPAQHLRRLLDERWSCRAFTAQQVPTDVIEEMLATAQRTASWCNTQPWRLTLASGEGTARFRRALQQAAATLPAHSDIAFPPAYEGVHLARRRESGFQLYDAMQIARGDRAASTAQGLRNFDFFDAPHVLIVTTPKALGTYGAVDCGGWVATFLLAARAAGVATIAQAALARHSDVVRAHFGIPDDQQVVCGISFGYADMAHAANSYRTSRAPLEEVVTWVRD